MSKSKIAICPDCNFEFIYKGTAIRPRVICKSKNCSKQFYIKTAQITQNLENKIPKSNNKPYSSPEKEGGADPPSNRGSFIEINDDTIESLLLELANSEDRSNITVPLIGKMIDFYDKIRGKDDKIKQDIPMEDFLNLGKSI